MSEIKRTGGPFHRRPTDRRLVRQVISKPRTPEYWIPMDLNNIECKLMEVKKFSAHYFDLETKFRRPSFELISAFAVQNPFLWGQYSLRSNDKFTLSEQMKMQLKGKEGVQERILFYPVQYDGYEKIARLGFDNSAKNEKEIGNVFYVDSQMANDSLQDTDNVRMVFTARVLVGISKEIGGVNNTSDVTVEKIEEAYKKLTLSSLHGLPVDTWSIRKKNIFIKTNRNEMYPDILLIYRDKTCPLESRSFDFPVMHIQKSLRSGTRYNPHEKRKKDDNKSGKNPDEATANEEIQEIEENNEDNLAPEKSHIQMYTIKKEWTRK